MRNRVSTVAPSTVTPGVIDARITLEFRAKFVAMIRKLEAAKTGKYAGTKGVHSVYDGVNAELKRLGFDPISTVDALVKAGVVEGHLTKGGFRIYVNGEKPVTENRGKAFGLLG
jgi:hypothetical protein